jgi:hypothetical protein
LKTGNSSEDTFTKRRASGSVGKTKTSEWSILFNNFFFPKEHSCLVRLQLNGVKFGKRRFSTFFEKALFFQITGCPNSNNHYEVENLNIGHQKTDTFFSGFLLLRTMK